MGFDSIWHWGLLLLIVLLVFGTRKIAGMGTDLGKAVRGFKEATRGEGEAGPAAEKLRADPPAGGTTVRQDEAVHATK
ncbi:MAG TPA: twin-arginine translocase TatA/TatE family subunit [Rhodanobacter sp.]|nr:twin-arginine translocase TatA/TatE family subunit [Rhodanobacter sp.]